VILLVNKWDIVEKDAHTLAAYEKDVRREMAFLSYAPLLFISAETGQRVNKILEAVMEVQAARHHRLSTGEINDLLRDIVAHHPPPTKAGTQLKFYYGTQVAVAPPTFVFFVNRPEMVHFGYERYIENRLREKYPFTGTPVRLLFRGRKDERPGKALD
jgi:GTP-binding protein